MLDKVVSVFKQIQATSSRTEKEVILKANKDNTDFRKILEFLYNPFALTGIKAKKLVKFAHFKSDDVRQFADVFEAIEYIKENNTGRDEDVKAIANFINQHEGEVHDFLQDLFTKDFKCGITSKTINKVYGKGTIPEFNVMLAKSYFDEEEKVTGEFFVTEKLDGIRCVAIKQDDNVKFFSRQGQEIDGLVEIEEELMNFPDNFVYDGELLLENPDNLPSDELFRKTQKVVSKDGEKTNINFHLFDMLTVEEFLAGKSNVKYSVRREKLQKLFEDSKEKRVKLLPVLYRGSDKAEIIRLLNEINSQGKEGIMVNLANGYYVTKRTNALLKVKKMHTVDLRVIGYEEGTGKNEGTLGALVVDYKGYVVKVGSGYTDADRNLIWSMRDDMIGKIIEVQYFEESSNQDGGISLRFPVFKRIRDDKDTPSLH
jgi:DNA ligase 1